MYSLDFHTVYKPITANPMILDSTYTFISPSLSLKPYIRCFWGSTTNFNPHVSPIYSNMLLIPDTCFDIILIKNYSSNQIEVLFAGLNNKYRLDSWKENYKNISIFGIRLHFWSMSFLSTYPMENTLNKLILPEEIFPHIIGFSKQIFSEQSFSRRINIAEKYICSLINLYKGSSAFFNSVNFLLKHNGVATLVDLSKHTCYSKRQIQRIFFNTIGTSPKQIMDLIRYQFIWQEMIEFNKIDYTSTVLKYNYVDQSHFIADFKKYHSLTPTQAINKISK